MQKVCAFVKYINIFKLQNTIKKKFSFQGVKDHDSSHPSKSSTSHIITLINEVCKALQVKQSVTEECVLPHFCSLAVAHRYALTGGILQMSCMPLFKNRES